MVFIKHEFFKETIFNQRILQILLILLVWFISYAQDNPSISMTITSVEKSDKGFVISGSVSGSNLNPEGQIVEEDNVSIIVDIETGQNPKLPLLPESMYVRAPAGCETPYTKGSGPGSTMTKEEYYGVDIKSIMISQFPLRKSTVWRVYGGLAEWSKNAPASVEKEFQGIIPIEYEGKKVRIRVMLNHSWGGPYSNWPAYHYSNDIACEGVLHESIDITHITIPDIKLDKGEIVGTISDDNPDALTGEQDISNPKTDKEEILDKIDQIEKLSAEEQKKYKKDLAKYYDQLYNMNCREEIEMKVLDWVMFSADKTLGYNPTTSIVYGVSSGLTSLVMGNFKDGTIRLIGAIPFKNIGTKFSLMVDVGGLFFSHSPIGPNDLKISSYHPYHSPYPVPSDLTTVIPLVK